MKNYIFTKTDPKTFENLVRSGQTIFLFTGLHCDPEEEKSSLSLDTCGLRCSEYELSQWLISSPVLNGDEKFLIQYPREHYEKDRNPNWLRPSGHNVISIIQDMFPDTKLPSVEDVWFPGLIIFHEGKINVFPDELFDHFYAVIKKIDAAQWFCDVLPLSANRKQEAIKDIVKKYAVEEVNKEFEWEIHQEDLLSKIFCAAVGMAGAVVSSNPLSQGVCFLYGMLGAEKAYQSRRINANLTLEKEKLIEDWTEFILKSKKNKTFDVYRPYSEEKFQDWLKSSQQFQIKLGISRTPEEIEKLSQESKKRWQQELYEESGIACSRGVNARLQEKIKDIKTRYKVSKPSFKQQAAKAAFDMVAGVAVVSAGMQATTMPVLGDVLVVIGGGILGSTFNSKVLRPIRSERNIFRLKKIITSGSFSAVHDHVTGSIKTDEDKACIERIQKENFSTYLWKRVKEEWKGQKP